MRLLKNSINAILKKVWSHAKWMVGKGFKIQGGGQELSVMVMVKKN